MKIDRFYSISGCLYDYIFTDKESIREILLKNEEIIVPEAKKVTDAKVDFENLKVVVYFVDYMGDLDTKELDLVRHTHYFKKNL